MVTLNKIKRMLDEQRRALLDQLDAVDRAIAALSTAGTGGADTRSAEPDAASDATAETVVATRIKTRRVLSDSHKQALVLGRRKAREAKDAAKGLAREMPPDSFVPATGMRGDHQPPRLVKRPVKK